MFTLILGLKEGSGVNKKKTNDFSDPENPHNEGLKNV